MAVVACGMSIPLKSSDLSVLSSSSSSVGGFADMVPRRRQCRVYSPAVELRTPQALGSSPSFEENEQIGRVRVWETRLRSVGRVHALGSLPDLDMFSDPRWGYALIRSDVAILLIIGRQGFYKGLMQFVSYRECSGMVAGHFGRIENMILRRWF